MSAMPIQVEGLYKDFAGSRVVDGISFQVAPGEIYGLIGPNGAGKTTTFRMLSGLLSPSGGVALIDGVDVGQDPARAKGRLGFSTGSAGLYGRLTAREQLAYFGALHGMDRHALESRIATVAAKIDLTRLLDRRCEKLSTGERQRVSIARALVHDPPVLILDEPTSGLDVLASRFLRDVVAAARKEGKAILFSTHYLAEAELLCDRVGFLHQGKILAEGPPEALREAAAAHTLEEAFLRLATGAAS
jgi:sodium transport system ATP-binding protein